MQGGTADGIGGAGAGDLPRLAERVVDLLGKGRAAAATAVLAALARQSTPGDPFVASLQGQCEAAQGRHLHALKFLDAAIDGGVEDTATLLARASVRLALGDKLGAIDDAARAAAGESGSPHAQAALGIALIEAGRDYADAVFLLERATNTIPGRIDWQVRLADGLDLAGQREDAEALLRQIISRAPANAAPWRALAVAASRRQDWPQQEAVCAEAYGNNLRDINLLILHGEALLQQGRQDEALARHAEAQRLVAAKGLPESEYLSLILASGSPAAAAAGIKVVDATEAAIRSARLGQADT